MTRSLTIDIATQLPPERNAAGFDPPHLHFINHEYSPPLKGDA
jgi:hypothetical protein